MKQYTLSALMLITLVPSISLHAAARERESEKSLISLPGALSGVVKSTWNTAINGGLVYACARGYYAALREYQKNREYWDCLLYGPEYVAKVKEQSGSAYIFDSILPANLLTSKAEYTPEEIWTKIKDALTADLLADDAKVVKNCALAAVIAAGIATAAYYLDKAAQVDDLSSYTDGTEHAQTRLAELARTHENAYFTYYGAGARVCKHEITQLKKELATLDRQESLDADFRMNTLHKQGMLARWYTHWLYSGTAGIINEDGTLNVPVLENLLAQRAADRTQRREEIRIQLAIKRLELQECIKGHLLEQQMPSQYSASIGAGLAGLATLVGSGYVLAQVNNWL